MKGAVIFSGSSPIVVLTSHEGLEDPDIVERLHQKGIGKFIAYPVPVATLKERYGIHFDIVTEDLHESDDLRVLDFNGGRAMDLLPLHELGEPIIHDEAAMV
ncbi:MAG: cytosolic protein [Phycisphaerales bacterium]|nr:MAG: cytosolic protein [Phycisphaerales bacterium]